MLTLGQSRPEPGPSSPKPQSSLRSVSVVTGLTFLQLLLQFVTQLLLAKYFGAAGEMDAYVAALALPVVVATILAGSLGYVLVPVVTERLAASSQRDAATVASQIGLSLTALSLLITEVVAASAEPLARVLCPGFSADELALTAGLLRILSILIVANSLTSYLNALFHSYRSFATPAVAGVIGTLATLGYVILLHEWQGVHAVAWGVVLGAVVTATMLLPLFAAQIWSSAAGLQRIHAGTRQCVRLLLPLVLGAIYWRLDPLVDRFLGSYLPQGSIAHIGYAWRLISGLMLIGTSGLSIVAFPAIAAHAAAKRHADLNIELAHAIRFFLFLIVPVCVGLAAFCLPVVRLLFEHGRFTVADTQAVSLLVALYVGAIFGSGLGDLLSRTCYAQQDTRTPVIVHSLNFTLAAGLKFFIVGALGAAGLVAATSLYYLLNSAVLGIVLLQRLGSDMLAGTRGTLTRSLASCVIACLVASVVMRLPVASAVLPAAASGALVYLLMMWLFGDEFALKLCRRLTGRAG